MKNNKKNILFFIIGVIITLSLLSTLFNRAEQDQELKTVRKKKKITPKQLAKMKKKLPPLPKSPIPPVNRGTGPSAIQAKSGLTLDKRHQSIIYKGREVIGPSRELLRKEDPKGADHTPLTMINKINHAWNKKLYHQMTRFFPSKVKLEIVHEKSQIFVRKLIGRFVEQVVLKYSYPSGRVSSYRALIDSQTGAIIRTWDRPIVHNFDPDSKVRFKPSGMVAPRKKEI
jgi:hypothetical protein